MNMEKEFTPYEQALELKELGFDEPCFGLYHNDKTFYPTQCKSHEQFHGQICSAPTFSQAFRFFREKYNTLVTLYSNASGYLFEWHDAIGGTHRGWSEYEGPNDSGVWDTYQEAEIAAIVKLIEIIKNK